MKDDLKPFLGSSTDRLVDWVWGKMEEIKSGKLNKERERDREREKERERERELRERERQREKERDREREREQLEKERERETREKERNQREMNADKKSTSGASRLVFNAVGSAVKSVQDSSKRERIITTPQNEEPRTHTDTTEALQKSDNRKRDVSRVLERRKSDEDYRRWRESSPNNNNNAEESSLKRSRSESENISVANKKAKVYITPEARAKLEMPQEEESESVTFTVTIGDDKATPLIEDPVSDTMEPTEQIIHKPTRPFPMNRFPYYIKPKPIYYVRAPRALNGRFKNMSLVLQPDKTNNDTTKLTKSNSSVKLEQVETDNQKTTSIDKKPVPVHIPPKKLPQNTPKQKYSASSAPVNYLASKLSLDSELPDITITRGGNMVWRSHSHEVKVEK
jgi:hypothetical protein